MSDLVSEYSSSLFVTTAAFDFAMAQRVLEELLKKCNDFIAVSGKKSISSTIAIVAEARYESHVWDIDVPIRNGMLRTLDDISLFRSDFDDTHESIFSIRDPSSAVEIVGLRATVRCRVSEAPSYRVASSHGMNLTRSSRSVFFIDDGWRETAILGFHALESGAVETGPAIVESNFTTVVIDPRARYTRSREGTLIIYPGQAQLEQ